MQVMPAGDAMTVALQPHDHYCDTTMHLLCTLCACTVHQQNIICAVQPINPDDLIRKEWTEKATPPAELIGTLLPYQLEGLGWMLHQEASLMRGGILADEMGMVSHLMYYHSCSIHILLVYAVCYSALVKAVKIACGGSYRCCCDKH